MILINNSISQTKGAIDVSLEVKNSDGFLHRHRLGMNVEGYNALNEILVHYKGISDKNR